MRQRKTEQKAQIYFSRPYRHLRPNIKISLVFLLGCILPAVMLFLFFYTKISYLLTVWVRDALSAAVPKSTLGISSKEFLPYFGGVYYLQAPSKMPSFQELVTNLAATLLLLLICIFPLRKAKGGAPVSIYFTLILLIHLIAIIFFMFAGSHYPYSAAQYSELYIKQQVTIWLSFIILSGILTGILGYGSTLGRLALFVGTMVYSFIFGCVRYLTYMFIISTVSSLYMATFFFSLGPLFDFLYLVCFYSIYINSQIKSFDRRDGRLKWHWL